MGLGMLCLVTTWSTRLNCDLAPAAVAAAKVAAVAAAKVAAKAAAKVAAKAEL